MTTPDKYVVIGAGHGGKATAAHLALMDLQVSLYNRTFEHMHVIIKHSGIELEAPEGGPHGFGKLQLVTSQIEDALGDAQMIMVVVPSLALADIAKVEVPHLRSGQTVILPGKHCSQNGLLAAWTYGGATESGAVACQ